MTFSSTYNLGQNILELAEIKSKFVFPTPLLSMLCLFVTTDVAYQLNIEFGASGKLLSGIVGNFCVFMTETKKGEFEKGAQM